MPRGHRQGDTEGYVSQRKRSRYFVSQRVLTAHAAHVVSAFKDWKVREVLLACRVALITRYRRFIALQPCTSEDIVPLVASPHFCRLSSRPLVIVSDYLLSQRSSTLLNASSADALAQLLTVPPYAVAGLVMCLTSYASDRLQSRGVFVAAASCVTGMGYVYVSNYHIDNGASSLTYGT